MAGGMPVQIGSAASVILGAAKSRAVGATVVQLGGTDKAPTAPALPMLADALAAGSTSPASTPAPEPTAPVPTNPDPAAAPRPAATTEACAAVLTRPSTKSTNPSAAPTTPVPPAASPAYGAKLPSRSTSGDADDPGDARLCSAWGSAEINCGAVDITVRAGAPAALAAAWATAADCAAHPAALVVGAGGVNGVSRLALAEDPA